MSEKKEFSCHKISGGRSSGPALISKDGICFYLVGPETGVIIEEGHDVKGRSVAGTVLIFPSGKGSSVVQADGFYQLQMRGNQPKAMIVRHPDTVLVATAIIMEAPLVDQVPEEFYELVRDGAIIEVDADNGRIVLDVGRPSA